MAQSTPADPAKTPAASPPAFPPAPPKTAGAEQRRRVQDQRRHIQDLTGQDLLRGGVAD